MAKKPAKPVLGHFAALDADGVLARYEAHPVGADADRPDLVAVPEACDLAPGRYRWNATGGRFDPLPPDAPGSELPADATRAIWAALVALNVQGTLLPDVTLAWLKAYGETIDAKG